MKAAWKLPIVVGIVVVSAGSLVMAQPGPGGGAGWGRGPGRGGPGMGFGPRASGRGAGRFGPQAPGPHGLGAVIGQLDLSEEQLDKIRDILRQNRTEVRAAADAVADAREGLQEAVTSGDEAKIRAAATSLGQAIGNQAVRHAQTLAAVKATLTEEQRKEFSRLMERGPLGPRGIRGQALGRPGGRGRGAGPAQSDETEQAPGARPVGRGPASLEQMFKAADTNQDGNLTMDELQAYREARQGARRP